MFVAGEDLWSQGLEGSALWLLSYLYLLGVIDNIRTQAFRWIPPGAKDERIPDFFVRLTHPQDCGIVQMKAQRYLTAEIADEFRQEAAFARSKGLFHLLWTDEYPLTRGLKTNIARIRRGQATPAPEDEYEAFVKFLRTHGRVSASEVARAGHAPALIDIAASRAQAFFNITEGLNGLTTISAEPLFDPRQFFLASGYDPEDVWNSLPSVGDQSRR